ncbi:E3 ubiquitin-protein ligase TM129 [Atheta coriaria]|uniref:E3 ubiquitin-protein ligase TM129 n=1 Tax=Dalotia coriaria TaxID=877792 RepID=UPI0031F457BE
MRTYYPKSSIKMTSDVMFVLAYILFVICAVHPPAEVVSAGFTISSLFEKLLGNENVDFIQFHIRRTTLTLLIYSLLPLLFVLGLNTFVTEETQSVFILIDNHPTIYLILSTVALMLPLLALVQIYNYKLNWAAHPVVQTLKKFSNDNTTWEQIATDINNEYRRVEKICIKTSPITTVIATENWIIKVLPLNLFIAHQSDASLTVEQTDTHAFSHDHAGVVQYITIKVTSNRVETFKLRLKALDFQDLQDRVARSINILPEVKFHKSIIEQFTDVFKDAIKDNVRYEPMQDVDICIGCMQNKSDIKLQKYCEDTPSTGEGRAANCTSCYCKPMWCVDCLASWFVHRQDASKSETWLSSKCTCPTCRATFCVLDVCPIEFQSEPTDPENH